MKISWIWIGLIPFLYLPNLMKMDTGFGSLDTSDFVIFPLAFVLLIMPHRRSASTMAGYIFLPGVAFIMWTVIGVSLTYLNYDYASYDSVIKFSTLKIIKFALYATVPLMVSSRLINNTTRSDFNWTFLGCCLFLAIGVLFESSVFKGSTASERATNFKSLNLISTTMAILIVYLTGLLISGVGTAKWRLACKFSMAIILLGFSFTQGRGGWIAAMCGFVYMGYVRGLLRKRTLIAITLGIVAGVFLYTTNAQFQRDVDRTFFPEKQFGGESIIGIDDGYRVGLWEAQSKRFENPLVGAGFYHRGGKSHLSGVGSHNFWLQMFLETGLVGGGLLIYTFLRLWRQARSKVAVENGQSLAFSSALVTAFVAGMSGEYFYGGLGLLTLLLVYAPLGSLPLVMKEPVNFQGAQQ